MSLLLVFLKYYEWAFHTRLNAKLIKSLFFSTTAYNDRSLSFSDTNHLSDTHKWQSGFRQKNHPATPKTTKQSNICHNRRLFCILYSSIFGDLLLVRCSFGLYKTVCDLFHDYFSTRTRCVHGERGESLSRLLVRNQLTFKMV